EAGCGFGRGRGARSGCRVGDGFRWSRAFLLSAVGCQRPGVAAALGRPCRSRLYAHYQRSKHPLESANFIVEIVPLLWRQILEVFAQQDLILGLVRRSE